MFDISRLMPINRRGFLLVPFCLPGLARAAENWMDRKPAEWTPDDIQIVLNHSAWVREASLGMDPGDNSGRRKKKPAGRPTQFNILVRWESGLPVRLARKTATLPDAGVDRYVISVNRLPLPFLAAVLGVKPEQASAKDQIAAELGKIGRASCR